MAMQSEKARLEGLGKVQLDVSCELGRKELTLSEVRKLKEQDVIEFDILAGEAFEIRLNDHPFAMGEVVVVTDIMAVRVTSMIAGEEVAS